ncbi:UDP-3-O-(3-hydroxymyristoyl)glucosamine N-acyltransferase [Verminephrobacter aporrectodeae]|uniref:UDP-3-O-acylglucosamine N-acyltransferase n=1 Tax=Verminephrobacter aporrectodeae subsp. tuberculatae TaxID=1110392 RepID=A0ABT3KRH1_9BURK|nr:UDP-3-O-(3-hydroxymyristoyl)glucosamine N-acyltransferase [Verminephrobacter aporrectodeae]MCW5220312.1 UDP-3-O-(3-hydroxymyristoyl)glucosamine N-acyltransferase [Verminephrobacter aporrectodeae subsp. tuberculatae]MCW5289606.1 UDP-3-O-(3-hydroxymyristoyl)glucosamine N-acyltransferase [Verminephrobacter aporrectodeae subsp. tuberculatae]MCW5320737.1 UDP-3-O-(3-hydroxymyristoyl)glucosamine N-acyltransferase [Verminephrobacter aporrectodeae subsp. tuberculatae]MCW8165306.1 UDP-3-O-(3-hydroxymy
MSLLLGQIVDALGGALEGGARDTPIARIASLDAAGPGDLSFLSHPRYRQQLAASRAACVIVAPAMRELALARGACIVAHDPYVYYARATQLWRARNAPAPRGGVHASAVVDPGAQVHPSARIGPLCVIERGAQVGADSWLKSRVTVGEDCRIGARCIVHSGVVIGADGFGFAPEQGQWVKIEQLGAVCIGDDVEIGANTCIDRGALQDTVVEDGVKLDNLIQIGHNVRIGRHSAFAGCVGVAGSARVGAHCTVGGGAVVLGHLELADGVHISAATVVTRSLTRPGQYTGFFPIDDNARWERNAATLKQLHRLRERIKALEQTLQGSMNGRTPR